ncbi:RDD family protein [Pedobacter sp. SAFR-022]|uniref:RDD family protein n=1 Tax=Pedobacter sp. SAFR-022 TaxID=3436861 RepID=UPI003F7E0427
MADSGSVQYTVVINGKPQGPYQLAELKGLNIKSGTFIRKPGMNDYKEAQEFPELRELLGFRYQQTAPQYFASFDQRLLASVVDYFLILMFYVFALLLSFLIIQEKTMRISVGITMLPAIPVIKFIYGVFAESSRAQGTLGKKLLNIKVTDMWGNRIDLITAFGRNAAKILSVLPFFFGYLYSFLNKKQQCFHDMAANTLVIKDRLI